MTEFSLAYGQDKLELQISTSTLSRVLRPRSFEAPSIADLIENALSNECFGDALSKRVSPQDKTLILIPDKTRYSAAERFLPTLINRLNEAGVEDRHITFLLANGSHSSHKQSEIQTILGPDIYKRYEVREHDSKDAGELVYLGETRFGTPISLNRSLLETDRILITGTTCHHYFAGFGGGPKMVNPGCAAYETITGNHALTISKNSLQVHSRCRAGILEGNPVQDDIRDSLRFLNIDFLFETVVNEQREVVHVACGDLYPAHSQACRFVDSLYKVPIDEKADLVVASCGGSPKDINLIQAHKSIENAFQAVKENGVIFVLAHCGQGIGSSTFLDWFDYDSDEAYHKALCESYTLNATTALSLRRKTDRVKIILLSQLPHELVERIGMIPVSNLAAGLRSVKSLLPEPYSSYVIPNASLTLPYFD